MKLELDSGESITLDANDSLKVYQVAGGAVNGTGCLVTCCAIMTAAVADGVALTCVPMFQAAAVSATRVAVTLPAALGNITLRRREAGGTDAEWVTLGEHLDAVVYNDDFDAINPPEPNVIYEYQWKYSGADWSDADPAWLTRTFHRTVNAEVFADAVRTSWICVAMESAGWEDVSIEFLPWKIEQGKWRVAACEIYEESENEGNDEPEEQNEITGEE